MQVSALERPSKVTLKIRLELASPATGGLVFTKCECLLYGRRRARDTPSSALPAAARVGQRAWASRRRRAAIGSWSERTPALLRCGRCTNRCKRENQAGARSAPAWSHASAPWRPSGGGVTDMAVKDSSPLDTRTYASARREKL